MPVTLKIKTTPAVVKPADIVSSMENFLAMATAAIAFDNVSPRDRNWILMFYLHRLNGKGYAKCHTGEDVPEPREDQGRGKRYRVVDCQSNHKWKKSAKVSQRTGNLGQRGGSEGSDIVGMDATDFCEGHGNLGVYESFDR
jgi:hypothetical protein